MEPVVTGFVLDPISSRFVHVFDCPAVASVVAVESIGANAGGLTRSGCVLHIQFQAWYRESRIKAIQMKPTTTRNNGS